VIDFIEFNGSTLRMNPVVSDVYDKTIVPKRVEKEFEFLDVKLAKYIESHFDKNVCIYENSILNGLSL
jgi:hypothetical protein